ncbi:hypothetical protein ACEWY4_014371 [Coilia grayii]|uniref:Rho-GAP domain-containing protein n=1 Tax=Coilia grayii TaxID=363190 RepID=A0ABD1JS27_9TELE
MADPGAVDLDQYELPALADSLRGYLQDLLSPIIPAVVYSELMYTAQETQSLEECGQQLKIILESPSMPQANHQLLVHLTRHLSRVAQAGAQGQASPRLLAQAYSEAVFKHSHFSADVNPEHHVKILEALIMTGGLTEMQAAPEARPQPDHIASAAHQAMSIASACAEESVELQGRAGVSQTALVGAV